MRNTLLLLVLAIAVSACGTPPSHSTRAASGDCIYVCERDAIECGFAPVGGRSCERACEGLTYASPADPTRFCFEDMLVEHYVSCNECLLGDTGGPMCDYARQFDTTSICFNVCAYSADDVTFCGHH